MDVILADTVPHPSGSSVDGEIRTARAAASHGSSGSRRSFSAVLHGTRGEERKREAREADAGRSTNKSDRELRSKETKDLALSSTQTERGGTSPSRAQTSDRSRSSDDEKRVAEDSKKALESTDQPNNTSSDSQGLAPTPLLSPVAPQVQANSQTNGHTEKERDSFSGGDQVSKQETRSDGGSPRSPLISPRATNSPITVSDPIESHSSPDNAATHAPDAPVIPAKSDSHTAPVVKSGLHMVADDAGPVMVNHVETRSMSLEPQPSSALPQPETMVSRTSQVHLGPGLPDGKPEIPKIDSVIHDGVQTDRSAPTQTNWYAQALSDDQELRFEGTERFSGSADDQPSRQHDQTETELPQAAVIEHQVLSGQSTESIMPGAHVGVGSSPPPPPPAPFVSPAQSTMPDHDFSDKSAHVMAQSVVFNVAQPDLGHVNIRVAMMNDVVHTHLSTDRPEVGQFLINGQDRLQAAFQANGLDMGQFRVQVDREWTSQGGHEWLSRNDDNPAHQQREQPRQQDQPVNSLNFDQESVRVLSVFA